MNVSLDFVHTQKWIPVKYHIDFWYWLNCAVCIPYCCKLSNFTTEYCDLPIDSSITWKNTRIWLMLGKQKLNSDEKTLRLECTKNLRYFRWFYSQFPVYFLCIWCSCCAYICILINRQNQHISTNTTTLNTWKCQPNRLRDMFEFYNIFYAYSDVVEYEYEIIHISPFIQRKISFIWNHFAYFTF